MYDPKTIQLLWQYMVYADDQVLAASNSLGDEAYHRDQGISAGSVHRLLVHCMSAQISWLQRLKETGAPPLLDPATVLRGELAGRWGIVHQELLAYAREQTAESLAANIRSVNRAGVAFQLPRGLCMLHVSDHASYHRGQINSMIKLAGGMPSPVMLYSYGLHEGLGRLE